MDKGRRVLVQLTAHQGGHVVVQAPNGEMFLLPAEDDVTRMLHSIASDANQPELKTDKLGTNRVLDIVERLVSGSLGSDTPEG